MRLEEAFQALSLSIMEALGKDSQANQEEVKSQYKAMVLRFHPNQHMSSEDPKKFAATASAALQQVGDAAELLTKLFSRPEPEWKDALYKLDLPEDQIERIKCKLYSCANTVDVLLFFKTYGETIATLNAHLERDENIVSFVQNKCTVKLYIRYSLNKLSPNALRVFLSIIKLNTLVNSFDELADLFSTTSTEFFKQLIDIYISQGVMLPLYTNANDSFISVVRRTATQSYYKLDPIPVRAEKTRIMLNLIMKIYPELFTLMVFEIETGQSSPSHLNERCCDILYEYVTENISERINLLLPLQRINLFQKCPATIQSFASEEEQKSACKLAPQLFEHCSKPVQDYLLRHHTPTFLRYSSEEYQIRTSTHTEEYLEYASAHIQKIMCLKNPEQYCHFAAPKVLSELVIEQPIRFMPFIRSEHLRLIPSECLKVNVKYAPVQVQKQYYELIGNEFSNLEEDLQRTFTTKYPRSFFSYANNQLREELVTTAPETYLQHLSLFEAINKCKCNPEKFKFEYLNTKMKQRLLTEDHFTQIDADKKLDLVKQMLIYLMKEACNQLQANNNFQREKEDQFKHAINRLQTSTDLNDCRTIVARTPLGANNWITHAINELFIYFDYEPPFLHESVKLLCRSTT